MPALAAHQMNSNHVIGDTWCLGCGLHAHTHDGQHRPDCTTQPSPLLCEDCGEIRLPSERSRHPWRYDPTTQTYHCPNHQKGATT